MLVFDTSAYINGWRYHYPPATFPSVWQLVADGMADGRIVSPHAVYLELGAKDDEIFAWARARSNFFVEPSQDVQRLAGVIQSRFQNSGVRDAADPFVVAEAQLRGFTVVTYEGTNTFTGARTKRWVDRMPGICEAFNVPCCIFPQALAMLGVKF